MKINTKICPSCNGTFTCTGDEDCWCEGVKLHKKALVELMDNFTDCICPQCMKKYEAKE